MASNNQIQSDVPSGVRTNTPSVSLNTVPITTPTVKPVVQESITSPIEGKSKTRKKSKLLVAGLWIVGAFILIIIGVLSGMKLYQRLHTAKERQLESVAENGGAEQKEESEGTMTVGEIQALIDIDAMEDSLREIEDAAVDIDVTFTVIDENLEESDDPPEL